MGKQVNDLFKSSYIGKNDIICPKDLNVYACA
jgi:hypothetical protein